MRRPKKMNSLKTTITTVKRSLTVLKVLAVQSPEPGGRLMLRGGLSSLIDSRDLKWAKHYHWFVKRSHNVPYIVRKVRRNGHEHLIRLHREIMQCPKGMEVHHIFHDTFDNRRARLFNCTKKTHAQLRFLPEKQNEKILLENPC